MDVTALLKLGIEKNASDLHLSAGLAPLLRIDGDLCPLNVPSLDHKTVLNLLYNIMNEEQRKKFKEDLEIDFSFEIADLARFRVNVFTQVRGIGAVFRVIPQKILSLEELKLPAKFKEIARCPYGLVLITGPTGSGKSTTLAALIDYINCKYADHIITIEDPVEFIHRSKCSLVTQREVHRHTHSFSTALRSALREDPDVILVGELRDLETIRLALTAAETGHLVFATLHTTSAAKTINRIIDVFPTEEKSMVRSMLSESLQAVIAQILLKKKVGGRVAAHEIMTCTPAIRHLIRENKIAQMYSAIQTGTSHGMQTMDQQLQCLVAKELIYQEVADKFIGGSRVLA